MNNQIENRISMYLKVETMLNNHTIDTASVAMIASEKINFSSKLATLLSKASVANLDITGNAVDKQDKRIALTKTTLIVSRALLLHSNFTNNKLLNEKFDLPVSTLNAMRDSEFYVYALSVKDAATPLVTNLVPYLVTTALMTQFNIELVAFYNVIQKPKDQISEQSIIREEMENIIIDIDKILDTKLDIAMSLFEFSNPSLYSLYLNARSIDQTNSVSQADYSGDVLPGAIKTVFSMPYMSSRGFRVVNNSNSSLVFALSNNELIQGNAVAVAPNSESNVVLSSELNADDSSNKFLIQNNGTIEASFKIFIVE